MKRIFIVFLFLQIFFACNNDTKQVPASENDVDAARNFIESALHGDYKKARTFIVPDSVNNQYLDVFERNYQNRMSAEDKTGYGNSSIRILSVQQLNDSASLINYSNSFKQQPDSLKVVKRGSQWLIDLKYSFSAKNDSLKK